jgi:hypothetical protein
MYPMADRLKNDPLTSAATRTKLARFLLFSVGVALVPVLFRCMPSPTGQPSRTFADAVATASCCWWVLAPRLPLWVKFWARENRMICGTLWLAECAFWA